MQAPVPAYAGEEPYVFVSYARSDSEQVYPEIRWLHENANNVWYDEGIAPGRGWRDELAIRISGCGLFVVYLSPNSIVSEHCLAEISYALDEKVPILAVFLEKLTLPPGLQFALQNRQGLERFRYTEPAYRAKLKSSVADLLDQGKADSAQERFRKAQEDLDKGSDFDRRYELLGRIESTPGGETYRAIDLVLGRSVTIKRDPVERSSDVSLSREFEILSSLQHPNIVSALDFGVAEDRREYLVLDLHDEVPLRSAAANQPVSVLIELLCQGLRALHFLHRNGVIHCALQPGSIVVTDGRLRVLDFALCRRIGTPGRLPAYIAESSCCAPELRPDALATPAHDLYALGLVFFQSIREHVSDGELPSDIAEVLVREDMDPRLARVLKGLLEPDPERRFGSTLEAFNAFDKGADGVMVETALTRESALQAARFVGRERELEQLKRALEQAKRGHGGTVLVSGESGVGKSRLMHELDRIALMSGFRVMRGHAVEGDAGSYRVWDEVTRHLDVLSGRGPRKEAELHTQSSDVGRIDEHSFLKLEGSIRKQNRPTLIILEDLHWAGTESVKLLSWLAKPVQAQPVVIVATYRPHETFDPSRIVEDYHEIQLSRLSQSEVTELAAAVLGQQPDDRLKSFLAQETEGNSLFIVETLRVLAEHAGSLDQVGSSNLPDRVLSGGMRRILRSRIGRLSPEDVSLLRIAAVVGRQINPALLSALEPATDVDAWAERCTAEAVLEAAFPSQRFTHEKLREFVLSSIDRGERRDTHRRVAEMLEKISPDLGPVAAPLVSHWHEAGNPDQEARFAFLAGEHMLAGGALPESVSYFRRLQKLVADGASVDGLPHGPEAAIAERLSEAYYRLGNLAECNAYSRRAVILLGASYPGSTLGMAADALLELPRMLSNKPSTGMDPAAVIRARIYLRLMEVGYYSLRQIPAVWASLRAVNAARDGGAPEEVAQSNALTAPLASAINLHSLARAYALRALNASRMTADLRNRSFVNGRLGSWAIANCDWPKARTRLRLAMRCAERSGDLRLLEENTTLDALIHNLVGEFDSGLQKTRTVQELAHRVGDRQIECWGAHGESIALIRLGRSEEARKICAKTLDVVHDPFMRAEAIAAHSILAVIEHRADRPANSVVHIEEAMRRMEDTPGISWWVVSALSCLLEAVFNVTHESRTAEKALKKRALKRLRSFARTQPLGQPLWALWSGVALSEKGKAGEAGRRFAKGLRLAESKNMSYDAARLRLESAALGQQPVDMESLIASFEEMGCQHEIALVRSLNNRENFA